MLFKFLAFSIFKMGCEREIQSDFSFMRHTGDSKLVTGKRQSFLASAGHPIDPSSPVTVSSAVKLYLMLIRYSY